MARIVSPDPFFCSLLFFLSRAAAPSYLPMLLVLRLLHHLSFSLDLLTALLPRLDTDTDYGALQRLWPKHKQIRLPPTCAALSLLLSPTSPYHHIVIQGTTIGVDGTRLTRSSPPIAPRVWPHIYSIRCSSHCGDGRIWIVRHAQHMRFGHLRLIALLCRRH